MRVEDLDPPRVVAGSAARILEDVRWLGLEWDEGPTSQSSRGEAYARAVERLRDRGLVYPCDCSRAEIARVASAPHAGEEMIYPGTCRDADPLREMKRAPALRVRVPRGERIAYDDLFAGPIAQTLDTDVGDFVLVRGDGVYAYQLAVVVDDLAMRIGTVVRGADLLPSTPRQIWLARELLAAGIEGEAIPRYAHVPLVVDDRGQRLAKRTPGAHVRALRERGVTRETILGVLAFALGLADDDSQIALDAIVAAARTRTMAPRTLRIPSAWAALAVSAS